MNFSIGNVRSHIQGVRGTVLFGLGCLFITVLLLVTPLVVTLPGALLVFLEVTVVFLLYTQLVLGLNLQYGHTGLVNFGHVVFFAVGGYTTAILTAEDPFVGIGFGLPWPVGIAGAIIAASVLGVIIGLSTLRLRGDFLAIVTLAAAEIFHAVFVSFKGIFGGNVGIIGIPQPIEAAAGSNDTARVATVLLFAALAAFAYVFVTRLTDAPYGRVLQAIRADELVTSSIGKPVFIYKLQVFVYGAALAGFAGGLYALYTGAIAPGFFGLNVTVLVWIGMLLGGVARNWAVVVGLAIILGLRLTTRFLLGVVPVSTSEFASIRLMIIGLVLVAIIRYRPQGIWGDPAELGVER